jgi:hypothetical protein
MYTPMNIRILMIIDMLDGFNHTTGFLRGGCIIKVNERVIINSA